MFTLEALRFGIDVRVLFWYRLCGMSSSLRENIERFLQRNGRGALVMMTVLRYSRGVGFPESPMDRSGD
jgi:hypothetical protein